MLSYNAVPDDGKGGRERLQGRALLQLPEVEEGRPARARCQMVSFVVCFSAAVRYKSLAIRGNTVHCVCVLQELHQVPD